MYERQSAIMDTLCKERCTTTANLSYSLGVCERTIRRDITTLSFRYPIRTIKGRSGGVQLEDWFFPYSKSLSRKQSTLLQRIRLSLDGDDLIVLNSILFQFDPLERLP